MHKDSFPSAYQRYAIAVLSVVVAVGLRRALDPLLGVHFPFLTLFLAILISTAVGGLGPGVVATILGGFSAVWFLLRPRYSWMPIEDQPGLLLYLAVGLGIAALGDQLRRARRRSQSISEESAHQRQKLEASEQELNDFFENANVGLHWVGADGVILRVNRAELDLLGYSREEYVGRHIADFHVDAPVIHGIIEQLKAGETIRNQPARLRCKDGTLKHVVISSSVLWEDAHFVHTRCFTMDVTDRTRVDAVQTLLAAVVESSEDAIITKTLEGVITSWNAGAERLFEYTAAEAIGQSIILIIPADRRDDERLIMQRLRRGECIDHFETVRVTKSGKLLDISLTVSPLRDSKGEITGASKVARDITARRQAERRIRTLAALVEQSDDFVCINTPELQPIFVNEAGRRMIGLDPLEDVTPTNILDFFWPADRPRIEEEAIPALQRDGRWSGDVRFRHFKTGQPISTKWKATLIHDDDGKPVAWATVSPNLGPLRESEERFRTLADNISQFAWMADAQGRAFWYNRRWFEYTGTTIESMQGLGWMKVHHPDHVELVVARLERSWDTGEPWEDTFPLRSKDGDYRWFLSRATPIRDASGRVRRWFGTNTDITEQREAEEALKQADRRKDEFLATLAHELRNPLAPIRTSLEIIKRAGDTPALLEDARARMERQLMHMERLVDDLLDISRITQDKLELRREPVEIGALLHQAVETCRPMIESAHHQLQIDLPDEPIYLHADAVRLAQVFGNLLGNACKYTPMNGSLQVTARRHGTDGVDVVFADSGAGIPAEMFSRVFEMFAQLPASGSDVKVGLGIGLTLARRLVELHGGTIEAFSEGMGCGSTFVVRLPVLGANPLRQSLALTPNEESPGRRRILIVDDNHDAAQSMATLLDIAGHNTQVAYDGLQALETTTSFRPDTVLLDIGLPKLDGFETARRIRALPNGAGVLLIALTGWGQDEDRRKSKEAGFDHHLVKPIDLAAVLSLLDPTEAA